MKRRYGFVSNSSSSSFIINIGVVTDMQKFKGVLDEYEVKEDDYDFFLIRGIADYHENHSGRWSNPFDQGDFAGNYFNESVVTKIWEKDPSAIIIVKSEYGDEGDHLFYDEGDYDCDYDRVDLDWFGDFDQFLYDDADEKKHGVNIIHSFYGAGRNG